ncbi:MAG: hypothetical protein ROR55_09495 [Devosia sp.]
MARGIDLNKIARNRLQKLEEEIGLSLVFVGPPERRDGYSIYFYNSKKYMETKQLSFALAGNLPFAIDEEIGEVLSPAPDELWIE